MGILPCMTLTLGLALAASIPAIAAPLEGGAVAAPNQYGADVAAQILKKGGNAVDAAVATAFTLAVTYPEAGNIGQKSTEEIEELVAGLQNGTQQVATVMHNSRMLTDSSVDLTRKAGASLENITRTVSNLSLIHI